MIINNYASPTSRNINFGITMRKSKINLGGQVNIYNCNCFARYNESRPMNIANAYKAHLGNAQHVEQKIWGVSDLSNFCATTISLQKVFGLERYKQLFKRTDLMDIDPEIAKRASQHVIGITQTESDILEELLNIKSSDYFTKVNDGRKYFLEGEDAFIFDPFTSLNKPVIFHHISDDIMYGTTINANKRMIDIRQGVKTLRPHSQDTVQICEFANGWYFMPWSQQIQIVKGFAKNLQSGDILRIGSSELKTGIGHELTSRGFKKSELAEELFIKK